MFRFRKLIVSGAWCCALLAGCAQRAPAPLTIAAAAGLAPAFEMLAPDFEEQAGMPVIYSYGSTANLAAQIRNGAPFDAFAAADALHIDQLIDEGLLDGSSRTVFASGRLALAKTRDSPLALAAIEDLLDPAVGSVVIANPAFAPYGLAARQALERSGLWEPLRPRVIYAENVRDAGQLVASGNAAAGVFAASTAISLNLRWIEVPAELFDPIEHVAAARVGAEPGASAFLLFLRGPQAAAVLEGFGLGLAEQ